MFYINFLAQKTASMHLFLTSVIPYCYSWSTKDIGLVISVKYMAHYVSFSR